MTHNHLSKTSLCVVGTVVLLFLTATAAFGDCPVNPAAGNPLQMLVIGDSIMWGQGLRDDEVFLTREVLLQEKTDREVKLHMEAHSGAAISGHFGATRFHLH
jgi:hypothetical protein